MLTPTSKTKENSRNQKVAQATIKNKLDKLERFIYFVKIAKASYSEDKIQSLNDFLHQCKNLADVVTTLLVELWPW